MTEHARILELAVAGMDFSLAPAERGELAEHLASCAPCRETLAAMRADAERLSALPDIQAPGPVRARVVAAALQARAPSVFTRPQMVIALALLMVALAGVTVAVGARVLEWLEQTRLPAPIVTPQPSASSAVSPAPQPTPAAAFVLPEGALPPGAWAAVTSGPLPLYSWPWRDSEASGQVKNDTRLHLEGVPIVVDGDRWVLVKSEYGEDGYASLPELVNATTLEPVSCPSAAELPAVVALSPWERLSCFGGRELVLEGSEIVGFSELVRAADPDWLNGHGSLVITPGAGWPTLPLHVASGSLTLDRPVFDTEIAPYRIRATGHFNDPASVACRGPQLTLDPEGAKKLADADPIGAELLCREQFVVTGLEVLGATPTPTPAPARETALLRVSITPDVAGPWPGLTFVLFDDGRLVTAARSGAGWTERRLTDAARDGLVTAALAEPLLQKSASYPPDPGWAAGFVSTVITLQRESGMVTVTATNASNDDATLALLALAESMTERVRALPDKAFVDDARVWLPSAYNVMIDLSPGVLASYPRVPEFPLWAENAVLPLATPLLETGKVIRSENGATTRCAVVDAHLASQLRAAFQAAGYVRSEESLLTAGYELGWRTTNGIVGVTIYAVPPDEPADYHCAAESG